MRRLDIGIASYRNPAKLEEMLRSLEWGSTTDWRCFIVHNPSAFEQDEHAVLAVIHAAMSRQPSRYWPIFLPSNRGYAGAINELFRRAETEYIAYCMSPRHRVLTSDLRWKSLGDLSVGDQLVGFDETPLGKYRYYHKAIVESITWARRPVVDVELSNGEIFTVTPDHRWLLGRAGGQAQHWLRTDRFRGRTAGRFATKLKRLMQPYDHDRSFESGWLAGMFDGEGSWVGRRPIVNHRTGERAHRLGRLTLHQNPGPVLDHALSILREKEIPYSGPDRQSGSNCMQVRLNGNFGNQIEYLTRFRPIRFLTKIEPDNFGRLEFRGEELAVVAVRHAGVQDIPLIQTSTGTMIVEGFAVHNCDNDAEVMTRGWDETLCSYLDRFHEIGMMFPNGFGPRAIDRGAYKELLWGVGFAFVINRIAMRDTGDFDEKIGHQNEADYCMRLRMAGYKCATTATTAEAVIAHLATATNDPASIERINRGVIEFVNKWNWYFCGKNVNYHSPNVLRWDDWPPNALYLEEYWKLKMPGLNAQPEEVELDGQTYDLLKVPRPGGFYRGRIV